jgi:hypothetical protein
MSHRSKRYGLFSGHSRGSESICKDKCDNVKTSYYAYAALVQSFQAVLAKIPRTLRGRSRQHSAFSIPLCNGRVCNWGDLSPTRTFLREVDNVPFLEVVAFCKGYQPLS